jgi:protein SCO1/2
VRLQIWLTAFILFLYLLLPSVIFSQVALDKPPEELRDIEPIEHLGDTLDLSLRITLSDSTTVPLSYIFDQGLPVILNPVYFECPMLCSLVMNGMLNALRELDWNIGEDFLVLSVSIDHTEGPSLAKVNKSNYMKQYSRDSAEKGWYFATADSLTISKLTNSIGFRFKWVEASQEYAHSAALIFASPTAVLTRYLYGIKFESFSIMNALYEAADGKIGTTTDRVLMYCFSYDPNSNSYVPVAFNIMKIGGLIIMISLGTLLSVLWLRNKNHASLE